MFDFYDIARADDPLFGRDTVNDLVIDRYTGARRKAAVTEEGGLSARLLDGLADNPVDVVRGNPGSDRVIRCLPRQGGDPAGDAHALQLFIRFDRNHILQTQRLACQNLGLFNALCAVDALELALCAVVILQRLGLLVIGRKTMLDHVRLVVLADVQRIAADVADAFLLGRVCLRSRRT